MEYYLAISKFIIQDYYLTAREKSDNAGKKVSGIKRYIAVDTQGLPHAMIVTTANITDRRGALEAIYQDEETLTEVNCIISDSGYAGLVSVYEEFVKIPKCRLQNT